MTFTFPTDTLCIPAIPHKEINFLASFLPSSLPPSVFQFHTFTLLLPQIRKDGAGIKKQMLTHFQVPLLLAHSEKLCLIPALPPVLPLAPLSQLI